MNHIDDLVKEWCPAGTEHRLLEEVIAALRTGLNPRQNFKLNGSGARNLYITVRELDGFRIRTSEKTDRVDDAGLRLIQNRSRLQPGDVLFSGTGTIGRTALVADEPNDWNVKEGIYAITPRIELVLPRFLIYLLHSTNVRRQILSQADGSTVASISMASLKKVRIPVPPLEVQREIVRILDMFTQLEAELEAELEARRRQYEHYRDSLMAFFECAEVRWVPMGEIGEFIRGRRFVKDDFVDVGVPSIHYGEIYTVYGTAATSTVTQVRDELVPQLRFARPGDVIIAAVGETVEDVGKAVAWLGSDDVAIHDDCFLYRHSLDPTFVSYYLQTDAFHSQKGKHVSRAKVKRLSREGLSKILIPVPPIAEQRRIVAILEQFDALVNDLDIGLPAELAARRKQYEHYLDRLLTFKEAVG
jgi:type I restriction enzyme S subunit